MVRPPEYVSAINPYVPGKPIEELERELGIRGSVKLASNENPVGPSPLALEAIRGISGELNRYPDGSGYYLRNALAEMLSVRQENVILGNGSNELLDIVVRTFMKPGDNAVMAHPSFVVYHLAVQALGAKSIKVPLRSYTHDLTAMLDAVTEKTRIVFIANPNNPTGTMNRKGEFDGMMEKLPDNVLVVMDEAYYEYVSDPEYADSMKWFGRGKDILILRTFSKIYGLAGLRIGYGIAGSEIINEMNKLRPPFNTSTISQVAALNALRDTGHVEKSRRINEEGKRYLYGELENLGLPHVLTEANFVYLPVQDAPALYEKLLRLGVIVRPIGPDALRVTIGLPEENRRAIEALRQIITTR
ncbi:MAG TPA: histidinol-phosphate transaminase [Thermodesulfovibrionales bacterium]|jgi:histidinol-phosphate aminotransferase|nr:histidinol-phosphate transaminase [Thermodesulfovibrionales bacterium]